MTSRLLLGDWNRVVRDPIDVLRLTFVAGAVALVVTGHSGWTNLAVTGAAALLVRPLALPRVFDLCFVLAMAISGWGEALRLYDEFRLFDVFVHFIVPLLGSPVVYVALARLDVLPDPKEPTERRHHVGIFVVTLALGLAIGAVWEIAEWTSDHVAGTQLSKGQDDTIGDLVADAAGAVIGAALLLVWSVYGWGTVRRLPDGSETTEAG